MDGWMVDGGWVGGWVGAWVGGLAGGRMHGCMDAWMHGCTDARMHGCTDGRMHGCTDARMHGCTDARMHGCTDAWMHGWMDGWMDGGREGGMDGWTDLHTCQNYSANLTFHRGLRAYFHTYIHGQISGTCWLQICRQRLVHRKQVKPALNISFAGFFSRSQRKLQHRPWMRGDARGRVLHNWNPCICQAELDFSF